MTKYNQVQVNYIESYFFSKKFGMMKETFLPQAFLCYSNQGINKRSESGHRTGTKDFRTGFYKGTDRAKAGT